MTRTDNVLSIIHYFTMKSYSHRCRLNRIRKELEEDLKNEHKDNKTPDTI